METWAHGLDVRAALGAEPLDTDRLAHVAWLATRALPYAYTVAGRTAPDGALRVELDLPSGASWTYGPEDAPNRITGAAARVLPGVRAAPAARAGRHARRGTAPAPTRRSTSPAPICEGLSPPDVTSQETRCRCTRSKG